MSVAQDEGHESLSSSRSTRVRRDRSTLPGYSVVVAAHPAVIYLMKGEEREAVQEAERRFMRRIELVPRKEYHLEQFDLTGK